MELLIMISTACLMGIFWCLLSFEKRTQVLANENKRLSYEIKQLKLELCEYKKQCEEDLDTHKRFLNNFHASRGI